MFNKIIIDGDSLLYRCGYAAKDEPLENALHNFKAQVEQIKEACECNDYTIFIKGTGNFRDTLAVTAKYKGTRVTPPPPNYGDLREYAIEYHGAVPVNGMEADDACSVWLWRAYNAKEKTILAAMDKDLWNTPGWHYNYHPAKRSVSFVTTQEADLNFIKQLLVGDRSDNIKGLPFLVTDDEALPIGEVRASRLIEGMEPAEAFKKVWESYLRWGKAVGLVETDTYKYFKEQGQLLWMTRELTPDGEPVLWNPPTILMNEVHV